MSSTENKMQNTNWREGYTAGAKAERERSEYWRREVERLRGKLAATNAYIDEMETVGNIFHKREVARLREALTKIANTDYRGNRSTESEIAYAALRGEE